MSTERTALRLRAAVGVLMAATVLLTGPGGIALAAPGTNNGGNPGGEPGGGPGTGGGGIGGPRTDPDTQPPTDPAAPASLGADTAVEVWCALVDDSGLPCPQGVTGS